MPQSSSNAPATRKSSDWASCEQVPGTSRNQPDRIGAIVIRELFKLHSKEVLVIPPEESGSALHVRYSQCLPNYAQTQSTTAQMRSKSRQACTNPCQTRPESSQTRPTRLRSKVGRTRAQHLSRSSRVGRKPADIGQSRPLRAQSSSLGDFDRLCRQIRRCSPGMDQRGAIAAEFGPTSTDSERVRHPVCLAASCATRGGGTGTFSEMIHLFGVANVA